MRTFYYVHTGHRVGLDRFRRASAILNCLKDEDITLLTSDYRIAQEARNFGIEKSVGIDVVRNIPQIAENGDRLIFDSDEANSVMLEDMRNYFSSFIRISDNKDDSKADKEFLISPYLEGEGICNAVVVDEKYFGDFKKDVNLSYFFGDDDYEKDLEKYFSFIEDLHPHLQLGFYYFLDYETMLEEKFPKNFEFDDYEEMIKRSEILLSASPQAILDSLATGAKPIYFQREDYTKEFIPLFEKLSIPIIYEYNKNTLNKIINNISVIKYEDIDQNCNKIASFIKNNLNL
ncbi:hypothetical protein [Sulfurimonas sp.]|uniref:hypothetical protein n=1 Tax=Sulfurimonas sp. TaxID=2022749 RepID=UPI00260F9443|nr:hypothetical protein [Sulfurimonas sp.]